MYTLTSTLQLAGWNSDTEDDFIVYQKDKDTIHIEFKTEQEEGVSMSIQLNVTVDMTRLDKDKEYDELLDIITRTFINNKYSGQVLDKFVVWRDAYRTVVDKEKRNYNN